MACNCKKWQLSGIPCTHANAAFNHIHLVPTVYRLQYFTVKTFKRSFQTLFGPDLDDIELTGMFNHTVLPPRTTRLPSRLKKQQKRSETEPPITWPMKCKRRGIVGHNGGRREPIV
ncbi:hypothetical protein AMTR_s00062p00072320 [Amborella trichopoda]|uniref:SWIM-type domain-containing protein n=1 Tax=Amborella trichopoda TaxID=13333 RepID=U5DBI0_AMBTC|nr:hypothetical protein AMTR_s00062p00072320 [Amborella trichopoda]